MKVHPLNIRTYSSHTIAGSVIHEKAQAANQSPAEQRAKQITFCLMWYICGAMGTGTTQTCCPKFRQGCVRRTANCLSILPCCSCKTFNPIEENQSIVPLTPKTHPKAPPQERMTMDSSTLPGAVVLPNDNS